MEYMSLKYGSKQNKIKNKTKVLICLYIGKNVGSFWKSAYFLQIYKSHNNTYKPEYIWTIYFDFFQFTSKIWIWHSNNWVSQQLEFVRTSAYTNKRQCIYIYKPLIHLFFIILIFIYFNRVYYNKIFNIISTNTPLLFLWISAY